MRFMRPRIPASAVQSMCCIALVLCLSSILGCDSKEKAVQPPKAGAGPPPEVTVVELTPQTVSIYRDFVALTYSVDMVEIRARVEGFIEERLFTAGQNVKQRDVLYVLDLQPYQSAVAKARADLAQSEANLTYAKEKEQVELTEAQAQLAQAEANFAKAQQDVARLQPLVRQALAARQELDNAIVAEKTAEAEVITKKANVAQKRLSTRTSIELAQAAVEAARAEPTEAELNLDYDDDPRPDQRSCRGDDRPGRRPGHEELDPAAHDDRPAGPDLGAV